jgi:hypothetical protein
MENTNDSEKNIYGGDTSNYGNANQGGFDRGWWERTRKKIASWFGNENAERHRKTDRQNDDTNEERKYYPDAEDHIHEER